MKAKSGFTIIELLVVIAIIAVLAGIVLVSVTQYTARAKLTRVGVDAENIYKALTLFKIEYGDYPSRSGVADDLNEGIYGSNCLSGYDNPYLTDSNGDHYLSEFYKGDYNVSYFLPGVCFDIRGAFDPWGALCIQIGLNSEHYWYGANYFPEGCGGGQPYRFEHY